LIKVTDILMDQATGDIACVNGDFVIGDATIQHQADLIVSKKGEFKESPLVGAGVEMFLNDDQYDMLREIRSEFEKDGMEVNAIDLVEGNDGKSKITTDADYIA